MPPLPGSPVIAAGSTVLIPNGVTTDQRGEPRTVNGKVDIGAVESQGYAFTASGTPQNAFTGTAFAQPLKVTVTPDYANDPVNGGIITIAAPTSGPSAKLSATTVTIASGCQGLGVTGHGGYGPRQGITSSAAQPSRASSAPLFLHLLRRSRGCATWRRTTGDPVRRPGLGLFSLVAIALRPNRRTPRQSGGVSLLSTAFWYTTPSGNSPCRRRPRPVRHRARRHGDDPRPPALTCSRSAPSPVSAGLHPRMAARRRSESSTITAATSFIAAKRRLFNSGRLDDAGQLRRQR